MNSKVQDVAVLLWIRIARIYGRLSQVAADHLKQWDLSPAQFDVLAQVGSARHPTQEELAKRLLVTEGNVAQLVAKMEARGLVKRHREGRYKRVVLTESGQNMFDQIVPDHEMHMARQFSVLTAEERRRLSQLLRELDHGMEG